mmetsp:Transcript_70288/g.206177  ORF Transcript_70288/g.206177 Transcript_70288/m.206177 type:complete len:222 (+) Transcript_70288:145-810(+)
MRPKNIVAITMSISLFLAAALAGFGGAGVTMLDLVVVSSDRTVISYLTEQPLGSSSLSSVSVFLLTTLNRVAGSSNASSGGMTTEIRSPAHMPSTARSRPWSTWPAPTTNSMGCSLCVASCWRPRHVASSPAGTSWTQPMYCTCTVLPRFALRMQPCTRSSHSMSRSPFRPLPALPASAQVARRAATAAASAKRPIRAVGCARPAAPAICGAQTADPSPPA